MAQVKLSVQRGKTALKDVSVSAGTAIAGSDAMELNVDQTRMSKGDVLVLIDALRAKVFAMPWPIA